MTDWVAEYAERIPAEVRLALDALTGRTDSGYAVVMLLLDADEPLRFGEIREELMIHQQTLTDTLENLQVGGVVQCRPDADPGGYSLSTFGRRILDGLYEASLDPAEAPMARSVPSGGPEFRTPADLEMNADGDRNPADSEGERSLATEVPTESSNDDRPDAGTEVDEPLADLDPSTAPNDDELDGGDGGVNSAKTPPAGKV